MRVNTKVDEPSMYLYTKIGEPPHQSRCKSTLGIDLHWSFADFGAEEHLRCYWNISAEDWNVFLARIIKYSAFSFVNSTKCGNFAAKIYINIIYGREN